MTISYPTVPISVGSDTPTTVSASTASVVLVPANPLRSEGGFVVNNSTKNLWITFTGNPATVGNPSVLVPANGGSTDFLGFYTGAVNGIWEAGAAGSCVVHQVSNN